MALEKRISELTAKTTALAAVDFLEVSEYNGVDYTTKKIAGSKIVPYKSYITNISQTGTSAPTVTGGYSQLVGTLTFTRSSAGTYDITNSVAEFTANNTFVFNNGGTGTTIRFYQFQVVSTTLITLYTFNSLGVATDGLMTNNSLEIKIIN